MADKKLDFHQEAIKMLGDGGRLAIISIAEDTGRVQVLYRKLNELEVLRLCRFAETLMIGKIEAEIFGTFDVPKLREEEPEPEKGDDDVTVH